MKRLSSLILAFILCISLCACAGDNVPDTAESSEDAASSLNAGDANDRNETHISEDDDSITVPQMLVSEYLKTISGVSDEWVDGTYLVYGTDQSGSPSYGILYETGNFEPLTGYEAYYPLANGNFFVTDDENFIKEFDYSECDSNIECLCANGKIIDRGGNILYESGANDPYQKMYIINSDRIFVLAASSNFDGIEVYWGVLDSNGNWVHELDSSGILVEAIKENNLITMNADGSWSYTAVKEKVTGYTSDGKFAYDHRVMNVSNGGAYNGRENQSLVFYLQTAFEKGSSAYYDTIYGQLVIYRSDDHSFTAIDPNQYNIGFRKLTQVRDNEWIQLAASSAGIFTSHRLVDLNDGTCEIIDNYLLTLRGIKYWYSNTLYSDSNTLYSDSNTDGVQYPENIASRTTKYITVQDGNVYIALKGDDDLAYLAIGDLQGNIIREPYRPTGFSSYCATVYGDYIAYANDGVVYICNVTDATSTAQALADIADWGDSSIDGLKFLGNDLIAVKTYRSNRGYAWHIYNLNGDRMA